MLDAVKRYATKVLLIHLALLALVISFVVAGAQEVKSSARREAETESEDRLALLADQTAQGVESHYESILSDLDVILREDPTTTAPATAPAALLPPWDGRPLAVTSRSGAEALEALLQMGRLVPVAAPAPSVPGFGGNGEGSGRGLGGGEAGGAFRGGRGGRGNQGGQGGAGGRFGNGGGGGGRGFGGRGNLGPAVITNERTLNLLWRQLRGRVSQLFLVETNTQVVRPVFPNGTQTAAAALVRDNLAWLKSVKDAQMSSFKVTENAAGKGTTGGTSPQEHLGYHLIAVQAAEVGGGLGAVGPIGNTLEGANPARGAGGAGTAGGAGLGGAGPGFGAGGGGGGGPGGGFGPRGQGFGGRGGRGGRGPGFGGPAPGGGGAGEPGFAGPPPGAPGGPPPAPAGAGGFGMPGGGGGGRGAYGGGRGESGGPGAEGPAEAQGAAGPATREAPHEVLVAVVPIDNVRAKFLDHLNLQGVGSTATGTAPNAAAGGHEVNATLVNDDGDILVSSSLHAVGTNLLQAVTPEVREKLAPLIARDNARPVVLDQAFEVGGVRIEPQIIVSAQLEVPSGHHWTVLISSPVADAQELVNRVFHSALQWAVFVTLSVTGILISTAIFMIRSRVKLERTRHEVLTRELAQARHIQLAWLPDLKSVPEGVTMSAVNLPASHISGDFYNWFTLPPLPVRGAAGGQEGAEPLGRTNKVAVVIGDVTGHGMAAAFLMATTQLLVRMTLSRYHDTGRCLREVNQQLCTQAGGGFKGQFVTMLVMLLDTTNNTVQIATAGHPTPLVERADGTFEPLEMEPQLVLGVNPKEDYGSQTFSLEPGASMLLYTDGVIEAEDAERKQYGVTRLMGLLDSQAGKAKGGVVEPGARIQAILDDVKKFAGGRELLDDVTLVALRTLALPAKKIVRA